MFESIGPHPTYFGSSGLSFSADCYKYRPGMDEYDSKIALWENIQRLMLRDWKGVLKGRLAREAELAPATLTRIAKMQTSVGVDVVESIARVFKVHPWQLIAPRLGAGLHLVVDGVITPVIDARTLPEIAKESPELTHIKPLSDKKTPADSAIMMKSEMHSLMATLENHPERLHAALTVAQNPEILDLLFETTQSPQNPSKGTHGQPSSSSPGAKSKTNRATKARP